MTDQYQLYVNGEWIKSEDSFEVINPATEQVIASVCAASENAVESAVAAASAAFGSWRKLPVDARAGLMHAAAASIMQNMDELAELLTAEQGKPLLESRAEVEWSAKTITYYAELAKNQIGRIAPPAGDTQLNLVLKEPYGVVAAIVPFNYPLLLLMWKAAPALMMGNTLVIKPSELTPLSTLRMLELCFQDLPNGVVNCVTGFSSVGKALVRHADVPVVAFTGSTETGTDIIRQTAGQNKKLHLEMGGKDAFVIAPGEDIECAAAAIAWSGFYNSGQVCTSTERVYVHRDSYDAFVSELVARVATLVQGNGNESNVDLGPMISDVSHKKLDAHIQDALDLGAKLEIGGGRSEAFESGYYYQPTVLSDVNHGMLCMREESFGPLVSVMPYDSFDEAIALVNDSPFGLGACCRTSNPLLAKRFYEDVKAGTIWINDPLPDNIAAPFGGMKMSGNARELGMEGLDSFAEVKHVHWDFDLGAKEHWIGP
jgi:acyl-CoA reductase-like NAD-dependent aldehyde dehydrogenase